MVTSVLLVPFSSSCAQRQQSLTCLLLIVTWCHLGGVESSDSESDVDEDEDPQKQR